MAYLALNLAFGAALVAGGLISGSGLARLPFVAMMFAICTSPLPSIDRLNGPFAILSVAMAVFFIEFAALDAFNMFSAPKTPAGAADFLAPAEWVLLTGAALKIFGFRSAVYFTRQTRTRGELRDWPRPLLVPIGLSLWLAGSFATLFQSLVLVVENTERATVEGLAALGNWGSFGLILVSNYAGPLGIVVLAYWWSVWGRRSGTALMLFIIFAQFVIGWLVDTKEVAVAAPLVIILTRFVVRGKVPLRWLLCSIVGIALVFPVLTAKRLIMTEGLHLTRAEALPRTFEILARAIAERDVAREGRKYEQSSGTFLERLTDKGAVELFVAHSGVDHSYRMGSTLEPLLYIFLPRVLWSAKPGGNSAVDFNREFHISEDPDTHISPSHIGELYWNFGVIAVIFGMTAFGAILGYVTVKFDVSSAVSMTRTLVVMVTLYQVVVRGGGQIELEYVVWLRTLVLIGILHLLLSRRASGSRPASSPAVTGASVQSPAQAVTPFRHLPI